MECEVVGSNLPPSPPQVPPMSGSGACHECSRKPSADLDPHPTRRQAQPRPKHGHVRNPALTVIVLMTVTLALTVVILVTLTVATP